MYNNYGMRSPEQIQAEYNQIMNNYRNIYDRASQLQGLNYNLPQNIPAPTIQNGGDYRYVNSYEDVVNASTRLDGTATLFVNFANGIIWSKKFVNGTHEIQTFKFYPLVNTETKENEQKDEQVLQVGKTELDDIYARLDKLEKGAQNEYKTDNRLDKINN